MIIVFATAFYLIGCFAAYGLQCAYWDWAGEDKYALMHDGRASRDDMLKSALVALASWAAVGSIMVLTSENLESPFGAGFRLNVRPSSEFKERK